MNCLRLLLTIVLPMSVNRGWQQTVMDMFMQSGKICGTVGILTFTSTIRLTMEKRGRHLTFGLILIRYLETQAHHKLLVTIVAMSMLYGETLEAVIPMFILI